MLFGKLLPREGNFFELIIQHGAHIAEGSRAFVALIQNYADPVMRQKHADAVDHAERQADKITAEVNRLLHKTFITPIDRCRCTTCARSPTRCCGWPNSRPSAATESRMS
mgnify:CR=1 FL=1